MLLLGLSYLRTYALTTKYNSADILPLFCLEVRAPRVLELTFPAGLLPLLQADLIPQSSTNNCALLLGLLAPYCTSVPP